MNNTIEEEIRLDLKSFSEELGLKYDTKVKIYTVFNKKNDTDYITLDLLFQCLISTLETNNPELIKYFTTSEKTRKAAYINYAHSFCYIARKYHFTCHAVGNYINKNHSTIVHATKRAQNLLDTNDCDFSFKYNLLIKNINAHVEFISNDTEKQHNVKSVLLNVFV